MNLIAPENQRVRRTQDERRASSEEALVRAAIDVMKEKGVAGLTLAEVALVAGVSKGLVVHMYGNKQALQLAALSRMRSDFSSRYGAMESDELGVDLIRRYVRGIFAGLENNETNARLFSALLSEALFHDRAFAEGVAAMHDATKQLIQDCLAQEQRNGKRLASHDLDALATFILSWVRGAVQIYCLNEAGGKKTVNLDSMLVLIDQALDTLVVDPHASAV